MTTSPISASDIVYVTRRSLEEALPSSKEGNRKAISEGSEMDRTWPMWAPARAGVVTFADNVNRKVSTESPRRYTYSGGKHWRAFHCLPTGAAFRAFQPVASCFRIAESLACEGSASWNWLDDLRSDNDEVRFPAVKAARVLGAAAAAETLVEVAESEANDWRVRLEAHASLAIIRPQSLAALREFAEGADSSADVRMEAVFALSELDVDAAAEALFAIADTQDGTIPEEVRAAAAWGLGTGAKIDPRKLVALADDTNMLVSTHAAAALPHQLPDECVRTLQSWLAGSDARRAATAAHLLGRRGLVKELALSSGAATDQVRRLIVLALGDVSHDASREVLSELDAPSQAALETLWTRQQDWLRQPDTDGVLDALDQQKLRR